MKENVEKRVINIIVDGSHITKDSRRAGVRGEGNATTMKFTFGGSWEGYAKSVIFLNAKGEKPTEVVLSDPIDDDKTNNNTAECKVPFEALEEEGECSFVVRGILTKTDEEGNVRITKEQRTETETLVVLPCEEIENPENAKEPTADVVEQLKQKVQEAIDAEKEHQEEVKKELEGVNQKQKEFDSELDEFGTELEGFGEKLAQEETVFDEKIKTHNRSEDAHGGLLKTLKDNVENLVNAKVAKDGTAAFSVGYDVGLYYRKDGSKTYLQERLTAGKPGQYVGFDEDGNVKVCGTADAEVLQSIEIKKMPDKMEYTYLDSFLPDGMVVEATYQDAENKKMFKRIVTGVRCEPAQFASDWKTDNAPSEEDWASGVVNTAVTVSYTERGVTKETTIDGVKILPKDIEFIPQLNGETSFVYNGNPQYPAEIDNYRDSKLMGFFAGGDNPNEAVNAGEYSVIYTPIPGYKWPGGQSAVILTWVITQAPGKFSVDKTGIEIVWWDGSDPKQEITVTDISEGLTFEAKSSNEAVATVMVNKNTVIVTAEENDKDVERTCVITLKPKEEKGSNYSAPVEIKCTVTVKMRSSVFENNSWETIIKSVQLNDVPKTWVVGNAKTLEFTSYLSMEEGSSFLYPYTVRIIGKQHDEYAEVLENGVIKAPLTFMLDEVTPDQGAMQTDIVVGDPWADTTMRRKFLPQIKALLPEEVRNAIRPVVKGSLWEDGSFVVRRSYTNDELFLLAESELRGMNANWECSYAYGYEGDQYEFFKNNPSLVKRRVNGTNACWWSRSLSKKVFGNYCRISGSGEYCHSGQDVNYGVSFAFCF